MKGEDETRRTQRPNEAVAEAESEEVGSSRHPHVCTARALREARALPGACGAPTRHAHRSSAFRALSISLSSLTTVNGESSVDKDIAEATDSSSKSKLCNR